jgi:hypothetical protein
MINTTFYRIAAKVWYFFDTPNFAGLKGYRWS